MQLFRITIRETTDFMIYERRGQEHTVMASPLSSAITT